MPGYVYLVWVEGTDKYKIGSSDYPERRVSQLQTGCPYKLQLLVAMECVEESSECVERRLHQKFRRFRTIGEYFAFPPTRLPEVLDAFSVSTKFIQDKIAEARAEIPAESRQKIKNTFEELLGDASAEGITLGYVLAEMKYLREALEAGQHPCISNIAGIAARVKKLEDDRISLLLKLSFGDSAEHSLTASRALRQLASLEMQDIDSALAVLSEYV